MTMTTQMRGPLDAPDWFAQRCEELSRLMSSTPKSVADGLWAELIQRGLVTPHVVPGRVHGPLGWKKVEVTQASINTANVGTATVASSG